ncbi:MAG: aryl-sulfate sulfotransferase [archaeon]|nr:aryl-sulfate sulfotransferase [archaeon]MDA1167527.1 aryl-sulfate sulfotransferase [archaeon]
MVTQYKTHNNNHKKHTNNKQTFVSIFFVAFMISSLFSGISSSNSESSQGSQPTPAVCLKQHINADAGIIHCNKNTQEGYTLFATNADPNIYLIDQRGEMVHMWTSKETKASGFGMDLGENGTLLRVLDVENGTQTAMQAGGGATKIEILDWNSNLLWSIEQNSDQLRFHHDAKFLPNGNVIAILWEFFDDSEAIALGRNEEDLIGRGLWPDAIIEYQQSDSGLAEVVWEWHFMDHIIQDVDPELPNFGSISDYPRKLNINAVGPNSAADDPDWLHCNSIEYDPIHDHIMLSCRHTEEIYIIDHSVSWENASTDQGDFLYRWGNPQNYGGPPTEHHTRVQHDARFVPPGYPNEGAITYFSNRMWGPSSVGLLHLPRNGSSFDINQTTGIFGPSQPDYHMVLPSGWGPRFQSGAVYLPNGQFLITHAMVGKMAQMGWDGEIDWLYNIPLEPDGSPSDRLSKNSITIAFKSEWFEVNDSRLSNVTVNKYGVIERYIDACDDGRDDVLWDYNGDGCFEDDDNDGIDNSLDWCPSSLANAEVDEFGCQVIQQPDVEGCTDPNALNFDSAATVDDGSCFYPPPPVTGCMNENATNFNPDATEHDESMCEYEPEDPPPVEGCTDETATNFDETAEIEDGSCEYPPPPVVKKEGCLDANATNFDSTNEIHNESMCTYPLPPATIKGCIYPTALNYDRFANIDDGSCIFEQDTSQEQNDGQITDDCSSNCEDLNSDKQASIRAFTTSQLLLIIGVVGAVLLTFVLAIFLQRD